MSKDKHYFKGAGQLNSENCKAIEVKRWERRSFAPNRNSIAEKLENN
jgi:hypothetical protein